MLSKSLPHCTSLYALIRTLYSPLSILHFSLSIEYCRIDFILSLYIIYYRHAITDHEGALSRITLYICAICTCHIFCISCNTSLSSCIIVFTTLHMSNNHFSAINTYVHGYLGCVLCLCCVFLILSLREQVYPESFYVLASQSHLNCILN